MMKKLLILIFISILYGQNNYPADSLLHSKNISVLSKLFLYPISGWQRLSYNYNVFNCQFYPSCSNFSALSIAKHGLLKGSIISADRIIRCNPSAYHYQLKINGSYNDSDGRLIDFVNPISYNESNKSPTIAAILSLIPGLGRIYSGRFYDGLNSLITIGLIGKAAKKSIENNNKTLSPILSSAFVMFYIADIYGGWRSAKYYQKPLSLED